MGVRLPFVSKINVKSSLKSFIIKKFKNFNIEEREAGRLVPVGGMRRAQLGRIFLLGDSAGMCVPINGGGIYTAMISAHVLYRAVKEGTPKSYEKILAKSIGRIVNIGLVYRRAADLIVFNSRRLEIASKITPSLVVRDMIAMKRTIRTYPAMKLLSEMAQLIHQI
ncbi:MAG: hypothetical protein C0200_07890 [Thermoproteota archaeon]|nr:MAG: hypothetical protein C0200_07890 [Candidatus Korarchaeota archaeon]